MHCFLPQTLPSVPCPENQSGTVPPPLPPPPPRFHKLPLWPPPHPALPHSFGCSGAGAKESRKGPHPHLPGRHGGRSCDGRGHPARPPAPALAAHQTLPSPRGCSQPCHWLLPSCQGNQAPPEPSWFKGLWVSNMFALPNDHILLSSARKNPAKGPFPGPECSWPPPNALKVGPPPTPRSPDTGLGQASFLGLVPLGTQALGLHCQLSLPRSVGPEVSLSSAQQTRTESLLCARHCARGAYGPSDRGASTYPACDSHCPA